MAQQPFRFDDGAAYDRGMGVWSQLAGQVFLDWLAPPMGLRWIDIGCGSGAFTELLGGSSSVPGGMPRIGRPEMIGRRPVRRTAAHPR